MHGLTRSFVNSVCLLLAVGFALAQPSAPTKKAAQKTGTTDAAYIAKALTAAPPGVAKGAGVARADNDGNLQLLRESKNGLELDARSGKTDR